MRCAASSACCRPSSVIGTSGELVKRRSRLPSLSPCLTMINLPMMNNDQLKTQFEHSWSCVELEGLSLPGKVEPTSAAAPGMFAWGKIGTVVAAELLEVSVG